MLDMFPGKRPVRCSLLVGLVLVGLLAGAGAAPGMAHTPDKLRSGFGTATIDGFGPSGEGAHQIDECIVIDDVPRRLALLSELVLSLAVPPQDWLTEEALAY